MQVHGPTTNAKFAGLCPICHGEYKAGTAVVKVRAGWAHNTCGFNSPKLRGKRAKRAYSKASKVLVMDFDRNVLRTEPALPGGTRSRSTNHTIAPPQP